MGTGLLPRQPGPLGRAALKPREHIPPGPLLCGSADTALDKKHVDTSSEAQPEMGPPPRPQRTRRGWVSGYVGVLREGQGEEGQEHPDAVALRDSIALHQGRDTGCPGERGWLSGTWTMITTTVTVTTVTC